MWILPALAAVLLAVVVYDLTRRKHAIRRNFPVIGHFRFILEAVSIAGGRRCQTPERFRSGGDRSRLSHP